MYTINTLEDIQFYQICHTSHSYSRLLTLSLSLSLSLWYSITHSHSLLTHSPPPPPHTHTLTHRDGLFVRTNRVSSVQGILPSVSKTRRQSAETVSKENCEKRLDKRYASLSSACLRRSFEVCLWCIDNLVKLSPPENLRQTERHCVAKIVNCFYITLPWVSPSPLCGVRVCVCGSDCLSVRLCVCVCVSEWVSECWSILHYRECVT